jgi:uncharacterized protein (DUF58 family)
VDLVRSAVTTRYEQWLKRRIPAAPSIRLDQRRIFIFPTRAGVLYFGLLGLLLVTAINYQNNAIYLLTFLLVGQFVVAILATYSNLAGLNVRKASHSAGFAGDRVTFRLALKRKPEKKYFSIRAGWPGQSMTTTTLDLQIETIVELYHEAPRRGLLRPRRLLLETVYPFGLLRAWTWLDLNMESWVYPRPRMVQPLPVIEQDKGVGDRPSFQQQDEFSNIRPWRKDDAPRQILWKAYAKQQPMMTMEFTESMLKQVWLDESVTSGSSLEDRLSALCYGALQLSRQDVLYGIRVGNLEIAPAEGDEHLHRVLSMLARYGCEEYPA